MILKDSGKISGEDRAGGQEPCDNIEGETQQSAGYCWNLWAVGPPETWCSHVP